MQWGINIMIAFLTKVFLLFLGTICAVVMAKGTANCDNKVSMDGNQFNALQLCIAYLSIFFTHKTVEV